MVLDFDKTLTCGEVEGVQVSSIIALLRLENFISENYVDEAKKLFAFYHPIEIDPNIDKETKSEKMHEWWKKHLDLLTEKGLTKEDVDEVVKSKFLQLRSGACELLTYLYNSNVKVIILSSNLPGEYGIQSFLKFKNCDFSNIEVISNKVVWGEDGKILKYLEPIIHSINKTDFLTHKLSDKNVLLIGDNLHDADMVKDSDAKVVYRIGVYENDSLNNLKIYKEVFDKVLINEEIDFVKVINLLSELK